MNINNSLYGWPSSAKGRGDSDLWPGGGRWLLGFLYGTSPWWSPPLDARGGRLVLAPRNQGAGAGHRPRLSATRIWPPFTSGGTSTAFDAPVIRDTTQDEDGPDPVVTTFNSLPPGLHAAAANFRTGGRYLLWVPASVYVGGPIPPNAPFTGGDTLVLEVRVLQVVPGQAMAFETRRVQQMMQQQQMMEQLQRQPGGNSAAPAAPPAGNGAAPAGGR